MRLPKQEVNNRDGKVPENFMFHGRGGSDIFGATPSLPEDLSTIPK